MVRGGGECYSPSRVILRTETVEQIITGAQRDTFVKQVVMTPGQPIGMVRKYRADLDPSRTRGAPALRGADGRDHRRLIRDACEATLRCGLFGR